MIVNARQSFFVSTTKRYAGTTTKRYVGSLHKSVRRFSPQIGYADVMGVPASRPILTVAKHGMERICDSLVLMS